ncbi:MAG: IS110 family transposase [Chloroflexota bacterium]
MDVVHERCAGLDVHKRTVVACVLVPGEAGTVQTETATFSTMLGELERLAGWLAERRVSHVALEATGVYWKAVYNVLEGADRWTVLVVNPEHVKAITGRKTDRADAQRLAFLVRHDLLSGSFIPAREQRELREVTRARTALVRERARIVQRLEKTLEGANIKLGAVVTELLGTSGQAMLDATLAGVSDPEELAGLAHHKLAPKRELLVQALAGRLTRPLRFLVQQHLDHWRELDARITAFDAEIADLLRPFDALIARLDAIPGVGRRTAEIIVAEIGTDVDAFPSERHLAAWAGLCPGNRQSGGRRKTARTRHGNPWLKAALTEAAWAASRCKDGYFQAQYHHLVPRRGRKRAIVAVAHSLITALYFMLHHDVPFHDLGGDYFERRDRDRQQQRAIATLRSLGYDVTLSPHPPTDSPTSSSPEAA